MPSMNKMLLLIFQTNVKLLCKNDTPNMELCMEKITSKNNTVIKQIVKLSASSASRRKSGEFLLEGVRLCFDIVNSDVVVSVLLFTENCYEKNREKLDKLIEKSKTSYIISEDIAEKIANTVTTQGVFCVCKFVENSLKICKDKKYIAMENLQDPSNLGAVVRTAEALGLDGAIVSGGADIYNPKALRASMGSMLRFPIVQCQNLSEELIQCKNDGMKILATVPDRNATSITEISMDGGIVAVVGNEGNGVSEEIKKLASNLVTIKMLGKAESLNASTAATIAIWEMMRK